MSIQMTYRELQANAKKLGLKANGSKKDLMDRLHETRIGTQQETAFPRNDNSNSILESEYSQAVVKLLLSFNHGGVDHLNKLKSSIDICYESVKILESNIQSIDNNFTPNYSMNKSNYEKEIKMIKKRYNITSDHSDDDDVDELDTPQYKRRKVITTEEKDCDPIKILKFGSLPDWIESSEFIKQFREDYPNDEVELNEGLVFDLPVKLSNNEQVLKVLESMRFFGISDWIVVKKVMDYYIELDDDGEVEFIDAEDDFPEFEKLWESISYIRGEGLSNIVCDKLALFGDLYALQYAHENGRPWDKETCEKAASNGHLDCLKYAHENGCPWDKETCERAARNGHLDCLKYAHENGCRWKKSICKAAASEGHLDCLKYVHDNGCPWDEMTCIHAASQGHLDCLRYAHENGCPWHRCTCTMAAYGGNLDCLKYAHENGSPWDKNTCEHAAEKGSLDCLEYAHENGCPWDEWTCSKAAKEGHLHCLKYAHENGCLWNEKTCQEAADEGYTDCLQYARENGCPEALTL